MENFIRAIVDYCVVSSTTILDIVPSDSWMDQLEDFRDHSDDCQEECECEESMYEFMQVWVVQPFAARFLIAEGAVVIEINGIHLWLDYSYGSSLTTYSIWKKIAITYKDYFINSSSVIARYSHEV